MESGRNTFRCYESGLDQAVVARNLLGIEMGEAFRSGGFALHDPPIFTIADGMPRGFEALLRRDHRPRGPIPPGTFIPVAEETGLITPLGTLGPVRGLPRSGGVAGRSAGRGQRLGGAVPQDRAGAPRRAGLDRLGAAARAAGTGDHRARADAGFGCLHRLRAIGVRIALDDFGTGYSSLSHLCRFPFDKIKIDRAFIRDIDEPVAGSLVRSVVSRSERLGMTITAEAGETEEQMARVRRKGCSEVQGFLLGRPFPRTTRGPLSRSERRPDRRSGSPDAGCSGFVGRKSLHPIGGTEI